MTQVFFGPNMRPDMELPTIADFEILKEAVLQLGEEPDAVRRQIDPWRIFVALERDYLDLDFPTLPPLTIRFAGILALDAAGCKMALRHRELVHHPKTYNSSINHDYVLKTEEGELIEFGHSMRAAPTIGQPRQELATDEALDEAQEGSKILEANTGLQLELAAGDCGVLYDRLMFLIA